MLDAAASVFADARPRLFGIAYRMLGSVAEAEDLVQEAWLRWQAADRAAVVDTTAFLVTTTTRLCINFAQSARARRETYIGPWLPEPVDTRADPELGALRGEALGLAVLQLLERLTPTERAAYVLREAFDAPYEQIAEILQLGEANVRQLVSRARKHLAEERRAPVSPIEQRRLLEAFLDAAQRGDRGELESLLAADAASYTDGNGAAQASRVPVLGRVRVAQFLVGFATRFWIGTTLSWIEANGQSAALVSRGDRVIALVTVDVSLDGIDRILWVMSPAKLSRLVASPD